MNGEQNHEKDEEGDSGVGKQQPRRRFRAGGVRPLRPTQQRPTSRRSTAAGPAETVSTDSAVGRDTARRPGRRHRTSAGRWLQASTGFPSRARASESVEPTAGRYASLKEPAPIRYSRSAFRVEPGRRRPGRSLPPNTPSPSAAPLCTKRGGARASVAAPSGQRAMAHDVVGGRLGGMSWGRR
jgi:hypothetical protein